MLLNFGARFGYSFPILSWLNIIPMGELGISYMYNKAPSLSELGDWVSPTLGLGVSAEFTLGWRHSVFVTVQGRVLIQSKPLLGAGFKAGYAFRFGETPPPPPRPRDNSLQVKVNHIGDFFPNLYPSQKFINLDITLTNRGPESLKYVNVMVRFDPYLDIPARLMLEKSLDPGEEIQLKLPLYLNEKYLKINTTKQTNLSIEIDYQRRLYDFEKVETIAVTIHDRNVVSWRDDRVAAVFINPNDNAVNQYTRGVLQHIDLEKYGHVPRPMSSAMILFSAMEADSFRYLPDPSQPFQNSTDGTDVLDTIAFPRELLSEGVGDCDDLTVLYCTLLENAGIETAFVTIPGHIFMMFNTGVDAALADTISSFSDLLYIFEGTVWIPVEVTAVGKGFNVAWELGAQQLQRSDYENTKIFRPRRLWDKWVPFSFPEDPDGVNPPEAGLIERILEPNYNSFINRELTYKASMIQQDIDREPNDPSHYNRMGALYRTFGELNKSNVFLQQALDINPNYVPALYNYAKNLLDKGKKEQALIYAEQALDLKPNNPRIQFLVQACRSAS